MGKLSKKRFDYINLPPPPPSPNQCNNESSSRIQHSTIQDCQLPETIYRLMDYKTREKEFLRNLNESIAADMKKIKDETLKLQNKLTNDSPTAKQHHDNLKEECEDYILPFLSQTNQSITIALSNHSTFEQLNLLHRLLDQILTYHEQNYQMKRHLRDLRMISELKKLQKPDFHELCDDHISDTEIDLENNIQLLNTILAAGNTASSKRNSSKRQRERSKSVFGDEIVITDKEFDIAQNPQRRQSVFSEGKSKVSKWTKVKAAFKWERANVTINECKSADSGIGLQPLNNEVARYLKVPQPKQYTGSSADSIFSSSSCHVLSGGSSGISATPGTISSSSSIEELNIGAGDNRRDSSKSDSRYDSYTNDNEDENPRSRSLDSDAILSQMHKNKTPWKKVKNIIQTHSSSFKGHKSKSQNSKINLNDKDNRDISPCGSFDSSDQTSPVQKSPKSLQTYLASDEVKNLKKIQLQRKLNKSLYDFESVPEGITSNPKSRSSLVLPPSPLNINDFSDMEHYDLHQSPNKGTKLASKLIHNKLYQNFENSSVPSSPSKKSSFFGEFESEDLSSGEFSEPTSPLRKNAAISTYQEQQKEINEKYKELKQKINNEFELKRQEWEKVRSVCNASSTLAFQIIKEENKFSNNNPETCKILEENLTSEFKKMLSKWRVKKQTPTSKDAILSPNKDTEIKKIDWNLWKTGELKLEGQGLTPLPDQKTLTEDFQKRLESWNKIKHSNVSKSGQTTQSIDSERRRSSGKFSIGIKSDSSSKKTKDEDKNECKINNKIEKDKFKINEKEKNEKLSKLKAIVTDPRAKEIEVQTSLGVMKFEGISRKFTRKLYEWEKARGIGPESSTFALLHPGYRPIDVGQIPKDQRSHETSPIMAMGRSLSLDSISPNPSQPSISHQTSSLSLKDINDMKDDEILNKGKSYRSHSDAEFKSEYEPEAVLVEVEDEIIIETAAPLVAACPIIERQTPIYKYEANSCNDLCVTELDHVQVISEKNIDRKCNEVISLAYEMNKILSKKTENFEDNLEKIQLILCSLINRITFLEEHIINNQPNLIAQINIFNNIKENLLYQLEELKKDEACCKELMDEKISQIKINAITLQKSICDLCNSILSKFQQSNVPKINIIAHDNSEISDENQKHSTKSNLYKSDVTVHQPKVYVTEKSHQNVDSSQIIVNSKLQFMHDKEVLIEKLNINPGASSNPNSNNGANNNNGGSKKKIRLRRMGSRQNSKTDSDSSDNENNGNLPERKIKRRSSRIKKSNSLDDEKNKPNEQEFVPKCDTTFVLKINPGKPIEQIEMINEPIQRLRISPENLNIQLINNGGSKDGSDCNQNIFIKTKRKIFTPIKIDNNETAVIAHELESEKETNLKQKFHSKQKNHSDSESTIGNPKHDLAVKSTAKGKKLNDKRDKKMEEKLNSSSLEAINQNTNATTSRFSFSNKSKLKSWSFTDLKSINRLRFPGSSKNDNNLKSSLIPRDSLKILKSSPISFSKAATDTQKKHLFKKNKDKPTSLLANKPEISRKMDFNKQKLEWTWDKKDCKLVPNKSDNSIPKITRKLDGKSSSKPGTLNNPSQSAPSTPLEELSFPSTPLSERAMKIKKAKEDFLHGNSNSEKSNQSFESDNHKLKQRHRLSQISIGSSDDGTDKCILTKSASVGMIASNSDHSGAKDDENIEGFVSLPRNVSRSGKISSKLGFATLANKLGLVKNRNNQETRKNSAVSVLCRQSLVLDLKQQQQMLNKNSETQTNKKLIKSKSSHVSGLGTLFKTKDKDKINKSKSENIILNDK